MPTLCTVITRCALIAMGLGLLVACGNVRLGGDALSKNLPPQQAQVCREAAQQAAAERGLSEQYVGNVDYQVIRGTTRGGSSPIRGFEAWVYPLEGPGKLIVDLSATCQVRQVRAVGLGQNS